MNNQYTPVKNKHNPLFGLSYDAVKIAVQQDAFALKYAHDEFIHLFE